MSKVDSKPVKRPEPKAPSRAAQPKKESQPDVKKSEAPKDRATISKEAGERGEPAKNGEHGNALKDSLSPRKLSEEKQGANCIDKASELARKDDQALFLKDSQNKDGNDAGHVVLQRDGRIVHPNRPDQPYENYESYKQANPQYNEVLGQTSGENLQRITAAKTPEERQAAIQSAGLEGIANEKFADGALPPERGTENEARAQTPGNAGMYGQVTVETQRPVQTSNGTSVSMSVKREDGVTVGGGAKGLAAEHDSATQRGFEVTMPEAQFAEYERTGQLPDAANPQSWHNGTFC